MDIINEWKKLGCLAKTIIVVIILAIIGWISECGGPSVTIADGTATLDYTVFSTYSPQLAGWNIAQKVYGAAANHADIKRIVVRCEMIVGGGAVDKYGHEIKEPLKMGSITVDDLDEVRRYVSADAYAHETQNWFGAQLLNMDYSYFLSK